MATWLMAGFQDPATPVAVHLFEFHDYTLLIMASVLVSIVYSLFYLFSETFTYRFFLDGGVLEIIWTLLPVFLLILMIGPSLSLLYMFESMTFGYNFTIKATGHQWYWSYHYSDFGWDEFDSFLVSSKSFRLLDVDNRVIVPYGCSVRVLVSSTDVIHSWAVPSLGVKVDAVPGRINQTFFLPIRLGLFYGQCSEICGMNHSFMPIVVEVVGSKTFSDLAKVF